MLALVVAVEVLFLLVGRLAGRAGGAVAHAGSQSAASGAWGTAATATSRKLAY